MKTIPYVIMALSLYTSALAQKTNGSTLQFIASGQFYKIDDKGTLLVGPIPVNGKTPGLGESVDYKDEYLKLYEVEGIEKLFEKPGDTLVDILTTPGIISTVKRNGKFGVIDMNGNLVIPAQYEEMSPYEFGVEHPTLLRVRKDEKFGLLNLKGDVVVPLEYNEMKRDYPNYFMVRKEQYKGVLDARGKKITEPLYDELGNFSDGKCWFRKNDLYGFINDQGKEIIAPTFKEKPGDFRDGYAEFSENIPDTYNTGMGIIDTTGTVVIPAIYERVSASKNCFVVNKDYKYGLADVKGKELLPLVYESIYAWNEGQIIIEARDSIMHYFVLNNNTLTAVKERPVTVEKSTALIEESTSTKDTTAGGYYPAERFVIKTIRGRISDITDSTGKVIWHQPIIYYAAENSGEIDGSFCELKDLEEALFVGNDSDDGFQLPFCFYETGSMKKLTIRNSTYDSIPDAISNFKNLHYLETNSYLKYISANLGQLTLLDTLILDNEKPLPKTLTQLKNLKHLQTNHPNIPTITSLQSLELRATKLPDNLPQMTSLKNLNFYLSETPNKKSTSNNDTLLARSVRKIAKTSSLERIELDGSYMDWAKALHANRKLINAMPQLKELKIASLGDDDKALLEQDFPKLRILRREW
ncbi:MAG: hypothetical protein K0S26_2530 [Bacteroidota bacterium]|jgi:hypothetical protein|nr:hypothetical protein [Bacteroidota bacterium]